MTINFCEVCLAVFICSIITIVIYAASWYKDEEKEEVEEESKEYVSSNIQGLENEEPIPRGELKQTLNFDVEQHLITPEHESSGEIIKERSDLVRLQDEDFRSRVAGHGSFSEHRQSDGYINTEQRTSVHEYDPVVHPDSKTSRLHLSIRYDDERSKLIVQILDGQGLIRPEQTYALEMCTTFTLIGPYVTENHTEKHTRMFVENAPVSWKEPMMFCITFENATKQSLYVYVANETDPAAPRARELSIPLNNLGSQGEEINQWYDLQYVQSSD